MQNSLSLNLVRPPTTENILVYFPPLKPWSVLTHFQNWTLGLTWLVPVFLPCTHLLTGYYDPFLVCNLALVAYRIKSLSRYYSTPEREHQTDTNEREHQTDKLFISEQYSTFLLNPLSNKVLPCWTQNGHSITKESRAVFSSLFGIPNTPRTT